MSNANTSGAPITIPASNSSFTYEPPVSEASPQELADFDSLLKSSISDISDDFNADEAAEIAQPTETPEEAPTDHEPPVDAQEPEHPDVARGMERLVQREISLQQKEQSFAQREQRAKSLEQENAQLRQSVPTKDLVAKFDTSPSDALKALGKDPATVVRLMIAEQLHERGEPVPPGLQQFIERAASERRISALEAQIAERDRIANEQRVFSAVESGGREYVKKLDGKKTPSLATIFKSDPDLAHSELMEEIRAITSRDPNSELTFEAAAVSAEKRLARLRKAFTGPVAGTQPTKLEAGHVTPSNPPTAKPPARPLKPWEQREPNLDAAIREAEREFHIAEARERAARK